MTTTAVGAADDDAGRPGEALGSMSSFANMVGNAAQDLDKLASRSGTAGVVLGDIQTLSTELVEMPRMGALSVHVDWIDLMDRIGEGPAYEMVGKLRDLLG